MQNGQNCDRGPSIQYLTKANFIYLFFGKCILIVVVAFYIYVTVNLFQIKSNVLYTKMYSIYFCSVQGYED